MYNKTCEVLIRAIMFSKETNSVLSDLLSNRNIEVIDIRYNCKLTEQYIEQYIEILYVNLDELGARTDKDPITIRVNVCWEDLYKHQ